METSVRIFNALEVWPVIENFWISTPGKPLKALNPTVFEIFTFLKPNFSYKCIALLSLLTSSLKVLNSRVKNSSIAEPTPKFLAFLLTAIE